MTTTLSQEGQVVIPQEVCQQLSLRPGDEFLVLTSSSGDILLRPVRKSQHGIGWVKALQKLKGLWDIELPERSKESARDVKF
jgi:AbrB family looped-hinge helix DNA binding protein